MDFKGVIIEESLSDKKILNSLKIVETRTEKVTERHKTPWLEKWTLHTVSIPGKTAQKTAKLISQNLDYTHGQSWYADFNNGEAFYVIYKNKVVFWEKGDKRGPIEARKYGISLGIPEYQVDFPTR